MTSHDIQERRRPGRPAHAPETVRAQHVGVRLTVAEADALARYADGLGVPVSVLMREAALRLATAA